MQASQIACVNRSGMMKSMDKPNKESRGVLEIIIGLMICSGVVVALGALPVGLFLGSMIDESWQLWLQVVAVVTAVVAVTGGAMYALGSVLNRLWLRRYGRLDHREQSPSKKNPPA